MSDFPHLYKTATAEQIVAELRLHKDSFHWRAADMIEAYSTENEKLEKALRVVQNATKTILNSRDTEVAHLRENVAFDHRLRAEHESLLERDALMTDENERLRAANAALQTTLDCIEQYLIGRVHMHNQIAGAAGSSLAGKKQRVRASEASDILGKIRTAAAALKETDNASSN